MTALGFALFALLAPGAYAGNLVPYAGEYRGIIRSDSSPIGYGEIRLRVGKDGLKTWIATGKNLDRQERPSEEFVLLGAAETAALFRAGSPYPGRVTAFRSSRGRWPMKVLFLRDPSFERKEFGVTLRHDLFDTMLLSPAQVARGDFDKLLKAVEDQYGKGSLPRLSGTADAVTTASPGKAGPAPRAPAPPGSMEALYLREAELGAPDAQHNLGFVLVTRQKHREAAAWFERAARQGFAPSQKNLGSMYLKGIGVPKDPVTAYMYYLLASRNGATGLAKPLAELKASLSPAQLRKAGQRAAAYGPRAE